MTEFAPWTIVKVPFPFIDHQTQRHRPALVIAEAQQQGGPSLLWVLMITSAENRSWNGDVAISDLSLAGLRIPCRIRPSKIAAIQTKDAEKLGTLNESDRGKVLDYISGVLHPFYETATRKI